MTGSADPLERDEPSETFRRPPASHWLTRALVMRGLGGIYAVAFAILVDQGPGLIGSRGITPAARFLEGLAAQPATDWKQELPTIFWWLGASDATLQGAAWIGLAGGLAMLLGVTNALLAAGLWALYLSFVHIGQVWYGFGWEILLLEAGFLAIFYAPLRSWRAFDPAHPPSPVVTWLFRWLAFRVMFGAGLIKIRGDDCWRALTCLEWHYETQPVPSPVSWLLHAAPPWFHHLGVAFNHLVELVVPFAIVAPRPWRTVAGVLLVAFQGMLIISGNLAFLNWLTLVICLSCFDDASLLRAIPRRFRDAVGARLASHADHAPPWRERRLQTLAVATLAAVVGVLSLNPIVNMLSPMQAMNRSFEPLHLVNTYGAFGAVGSARHEVVIQGTLDPDPAAARWVDYELPCKPGDPGRRPCVITPYHHRLDWQLWFVPLGRRDPRHHPWLRGLTERLLEAEPSVLDLFASDPFPGEKPRWVRIELYRYAFAYEDGEGAPTLGHDAWWHRTRVGLLVPPMRAGLPPGGDHR